MKARLYSCFGAPTIDGGCDVFYDDFVMFSIAQVIVGKMVGLLFGDDALYPAAHAALVMIFRGCGIVGAP